MKNRKYNTASIMLIHALGLISVNLIAQENGIAQNSIRDSILIVSNFENTKSYSIESKEASATTNYSSQSIFQRDRFSGDWWGIREMFSSAGMEIDFNYKGELFSNVNDGFKRGAKTLDNIDLVFTSDLEKSIGLKSGTLLVQFLGNSGGAPSELVGTVQGISNIETTPTWKLYQLLFENRFLDDRLSLMIGLYDLNSEFDSRETSALFITPSHGIGPDFSQSGLNGPSIFPTTSMAIRLKYENESGQYYQAAILDGVPGSPENPFGTQIIFNKKDGLLLAAEVGIISEENEILESKIAVGSWRYTSSFEKIDFINLLEPTSSFTKNYGLYLSAEKRLYRSDANADNLIYGFLRLGVANGEVNPIDFYFGSGITINSLLNQSDQFGIAVAYAHNSALFRKTLEYFEETTLKEFEINIEATYSFKLTQWFNIQPDIQYIINPAYSTSKNNSFVVGSRITINF